MGAWAERAVHHRTAHQSSPAQRSTAPATSKGVVGDDHHIDLRCAVPADVGEHGGDETDRRGAARADADDVGAPADLLDVALL